MSVSQARRESPAVPVDGQMAQFRSELPQRLLGSIALASNLLAVALGLMGLLGWVLDIQLLRIFLPDAASMKFNTALSLLLLGAAGLVYSLENFRKDSADATLAIERPFRTAGTSLSFLAQLCSALVLLLTLLTLLQYLAGFNLGIDEVFFADTATPDQEFPGRMSIATSSGFLLLAMAHLLMAQHVDRVGQLLTGLAIVISFLACAGYLLDRDALYSVGFFSTMALHTAIGILALALGCLFSHSNTGFMTVLYNISLGGTTARILLPAVLLVPIAIAWLAIHASQWLAFDAVFGIILAAVISAALLMVAVYFVAYRLQVLEAAKRQLEIQEQMQNERLHQLQRSEAMSLVAGGLAHDFNNLLLPIRWSAELGQSGLKTDDPLHKHFRTIHKAVDKATGLANRMMDLGNDEKQQPEVLDLNEVITSFSDLLRGMTKGRADIRTELSSEKLPIVMVRQQMEQVLLNLVSNACHAIEARQAPEQDSGEIVISTSLLSIAPNKAELPRGEPCRPGDYAHLEVADNGVGMSSKVLGQASDPFYSTREAGAGHGLGLATVKNIAHQHHGYLELQSREGEGTAVSLKFPVRILAAVQDSIKVASLTSTSNSGQSRLAKDSGEGQAAS